MARTCQDGAIHLAMAMSRCITEAETPEAAGAPFRANLMLLDKGASAAQPRQMRPIAVSCAFARCVMQGATSRATDAIREQLENGDQWGLSQTHTPVTQILEATRMMSARKQAAAVITIDSRNAHSTGERIYWIRGLRRFLERVKGQGTLRETATAHAVYHSARATAACTGEMPIRGDGEGDDPRCAPAPQQGGGQGRADLAMAFCGLLSIAMDEAKSDTLNFLRQHLPRHKGYFGGVNHKDRLTSTIWNLIAPGVKRNAAWCTRAYNTIPSTNVLREIKAALNPPSTAQGAPAGAAPTPSNDAQAWRLLHDAGFIRICAYQDDVSISGLALLTLILSHYLKIAMENIGLQLNLEKCTAIAPDPGSIAAITLGSGHGWNLSQARSFFAPMGFRVTPVDIILGYPVGFQGPALLNTINTKIRDLARQVETLRNSPASTNHPDVALYLARQWVLPKALWLAGIWGSTLPPETWDPLDNAVETLLHKSIHAHCWRTNPTLRSELELPESRGGLRFPIWRSFAPHAAEEARRTAEERSKRREAGPPIDAAGPAPAGGYYDNVTKRILDTLGSLPEKDKKEHLARINRNCGINAMLIFSPNGSDQDQRHTACSWAFACWYAFALLTERINGNWPDPQPVAMTRGTRNASTPVQVLDSKKGNTFKARGAAVERAFGKSIKKHSPQLPQSATAQPRRETIPDIAGEDEDACADWEFRWSGDPGIGFIFDVTAVNTRSVGRTKEYGITVASAHSRNSLRGPTGILNKEHEEKVEKYQCLYPISIVSGYAIDLVGTPSPASRAALVAMCKTAHKGTGYGEDNLYPLRMANSIQKEVAFATAKATAMAIFRYARTPPPAPNNALPPLQAPLANDMSDGVETE
jgi:hypothetical protein